MTLESRAMQVLREAWHGPSFRCSSPALAPALGVSNAEVRGALGRLMDRREISIFSQSGHPFVRLHHPPAEVRPTRLGGSFRFKDIYHCNIESQSPAQARTASPAP